MAAIKNLDRPTAAQLAADVQTALQAVADKYGLVLKNPGARFSSTEYIPRVSFQVVSEGGRPAKFEILAGLYGLPADCFGKQFLVGGQWYEITDIVRDRPTFPVDAKRVRDGKAFKFKVRDVLLALESPTGIGSRP